MKFTEEYYSRLIGKVFKILPMFEEDNAYWKNYTESLLVELNGMNRNTEDARIFELINFISGLLVDIEISQPKVKKVVFSSISIIDKIKGEDNGI